MLWDVLGGEQTAWLGGALSGSGGLEASALAWAGPEGGSTLFGLGDERGDVTLYEV